MDSNKIQGLERLKRKLKMLPLKVKERIQEAMEKSAEDIVTMMKNLVPKDSGSLAESIGWTWGKAPKGALTVITATGPAEDLLLTIYAGNEAAYYARWVEFGTNAHEQGGKFAGSEHPGTAAQPFFFPAFRALRRRAKGRITRSITKAAKEVAAGR